MREANNGYKVWDGYKWTQLSKNAKITVTSERSEATNYKLGVVVRAIDQATNTSIIFIDKDVYKKGDEISINGAIDDDPDLQKSRINQEINWQDDMYDAVKLGTGISGRAAGALALTRFGNLTPWYKGDKLHKAIGWYRTRGGKFRSLSSQRNAIGAGGHRVGARTAANSVKHLRMLGKGAAGISVGISLYEAASAGLNNDSNRHEVYTRVLVDVTMAWVGVRWGAPGWIISGSYFVLSATGAFGDWGQPSGVNSNGVPYTDTFGRLGTFGSYEDDFIVDYVEPLQQKATRLREKAFHLQQKDHTYAKPYLHYKVNMDGQEFYPMNDFMN
ncbi:hypothetical protein [Aquimarina sp. I32.4]|uniref:hypothetical protein n=1 Tax=Aquimarina sp. I32.4 TaxID=2053903 RepID=UPI000CDEF3D0|nr:hypothetical protein [Aquimarina sp. I32.4]